MSQRSICRQKRENVWSSSGAFGSICQMPRILHRERDRQSATVPLVDEHRLLVSRAAARRARPPDRRARSMPVISVTAPGFTSRMRLTVVTVGSVCPRRDRRAPATFRPARPRGSRPPASSATFNSAKNVSESGTASPLHDDRHHVGERRSRVARLPRTRDVRRGRAGRRRAR